MPALCSLTALSTMPAETPGHTARACVQDLRGLFIAALVLIHCREKVTRILLAQADELQEVGGAYEGNIAVVMGLKHVRACNRSFSCTVPGVY